MKGTLQAHSDVTLEPYFYEYNMKSLPFPEAETVERCHVDPVLTKILKCRAVLILVLLRITVKENTSFVLFTLEVKEKKSQEVCNFSTKKLSYSSSQSPSNQAFHFSNTKKGHPNAERRNVPPPPVLRPPGNRAPLLTHQFNELVGLLFCFIPGSYTQEKPNFQQNLLCDIFLEPHLELISHRCVRAL